MWNPLEGDLPGTKTLAVLALLPSSGPALAKAHLQGLWHTGQCAHAEGAEGGCVRSIASAAGGWPPGTPSLPCPISAGVYSRLPCMPHSQLMPALQKFRGHCKHAATSCGHTVLHISVSVSHVCFANLAPVYKTADCSEQYKHARTVSIRVTWEQL